MKNRKKNEQNRIFESKYFFLIEKWKTSKKMQNEGNLMIIFKRAKINCGNNHRKKIKKKTKKSIK